MARSTAFTVDLTIRIVAAPTRVLSAFFDARALSAWWNTIGSVTAPRPMGVYAVEWDSTPFQDAVLGTLGGVLYGTVMEFQHGREFFLADVYWLPPEGDPIGPMALEVTCGVDGPATQLRVRQHALGDGQRWQHYGVLMQTGWESSLESLKRYMEDGAMPRLPPRGVPPPRR
ncbi:MAG: hypothetical protein F4Y45_04835 [Acidobacteria bacterium]|nr:hypothetical protein [Acidobacteriota bacterium]MXZ71504.1 hypothetical protein [Acidobacteriota bacterium]MYD70403.1 hypothetical protein [Acidobacteriota bacterium]MYJ05648.1 hypothetical protein [Acidobacteriota bacterium]